jgi:hypothetical protein
MTNQHCKRSRYVGCIPSLSARKSFGADVPYVCIFKEVRLTVVVLDHTEPKLSEDGFQEVDWQEYYPDAREAIRPNMPEAHGVRLR